LIYSSICVAVALAITHAFAVEHQPVNEFRDPLTTPATQVPATRPISGEPILALATVPDSGGRMVAAGLRGLILVSDGGGLAWRQARVPVQSDLVSLFFVSPRKGWAVGHDGVILHTDDGGETWKKQFDGKLARDALTADYKKRIAAGEQEIKPYLDEVELNTKDGPNLPFLGIFFENEHVGYAVGSFGMLIKTEDGGETWRPWLDHIENPKFLNLNDIREIGGHVYIVGEQGTVYRLDRTRQRFESVSPEYKGSFFRIVGNKEYLLVIGLNGTTFRSSDSGRTWTMANTGVHSSLTSAALSPDGRLAVLVAEGGQVMTSSDQGLSFQHIPVVKPMLFADVISEGDDSFVFAGYQGIQLQKVRPGMATPAVQK
jgi:photosystem II stability/assembly factor-like uncharacterized protein